MWFRKSKQPADVFPYPGERCALDGHAAAMLAESLAADMLLVRADAGLAEPTGVVPASANGKIEIREVCLERQCDPEYLEPMRPYIEDYQAVLSIACGAGI